MFSIKINNLSHQFDNSQIILDTINMKIPVGSIYGFLGPNGAGKTTTLRLILGLLERQSGDILILEKPFAKNRIEILKKIGSLIEYPSIYGQLTAKENLLVWQKIYQCPRQRIDEVLTIVGLGDTKNKKTNNFSLGMKQRLGLAIALLNNPELIILDEPTNGLDPNGIIEIRELLIKLNNQLGITILISSHLLSEVEKLVTHVGLIHHGKILFEGELSTLLYHHSSKLYISTSNNKAAIKLLLPSHHAVFSKEKIELIAKSNVEISAIVNLLVQNKIDVYEVSRGDTNLENIFMNYIQ